jgi:hypothetical protein
MFLFSSCCKGSKHNSNSTLVNNSNNNLTETANNSPAGSPHQPHDTTTDFAHSSVRATNDSSSQFAFVLSINFLLTLKFLKQIATGTIQCIPREIMREYFQERHIGGSTLEPTHGPILSNDMIICPAESSFLSLLSTNLVPIMAICTFLLMAILFEPRLYLVVFCILVNGGLILGCQAQCIYEFLPNLIPIVVLLVLFYDLHRQRMQLFLKRRHLKDLLKENERNAEAMHALEMRSMIGNVAHDLKTVRYLFSLLCFDFWVFLFLPFLLFFLAFSFFFLSISLYHRLPMVLM